MDTPVTDRAEAASPRLRMATDLLRRSADQTEAGLRQYVGEIPGSPPALLEAMAYSLFAGGKRIRPGLVFAAGQMLGAHEADLLPPAAAIECVHTFSLVHDDLPAMDDDGLRRGRPTSHVVFGEAMAILAGDALLSLAFQILTERVADAAVAAAMVRELSLAAGPAGMIGGQVADIQGERQEVTEQRVRYVHERKTAALIAAACRLGAIAARAGEAKVAILGRFGYHLGLAFQLADDALDATGTAERLGKRPGKDAQAGKQTLVRLVGVQATRQAAARQGALAQEILAPFGQGAEPLRALADFVLDRTY